MADNERSRRVLNALKVLKSQDAPEMEEDDAPETGVPPEEVNGVYAPPESDTQRKLKRAKVRKSIDDEMEALWPEPPKGM